MLPASSPFPIVRHQLASFIHEACLRFKEQSVLEVVETDWTSLVSVEFAQFVDVPDASASAASSSIASVDTKPTDSKLTGSAPEAKHVSDSGLSLDLRKIRNDITIRLREKDNRAFGILARMLNSDLQHLLVRSDSAFTNYNRVVSHIKPAAANAKQAIQERYHTFEFNPQQSISSQLSNFRTLVADLTLAEVAPDPSSQLSVLEVAFKALSEAWRQRIHSFKLNTRTETRTLENFLFFIDDCLSDSPELDQPVATAAAARFVRGSARPYNTRGRVLVRGSIAKPAFRGSSSSTRGSSKPINVPRSSRGPPSTHQTEAAVIECRYCHAKDDHEIVECPLLDPCLHCGVKGHRSEVCALRRFSKTDFAYDLCSASTAIAVTPSVPPGFEQLRSSKPDLANSSAQPPFPALDTWLQHRIPRHFR